MMDKNYNPQQIEQSTYEFWESNGCFSVQNHSAQSSYCIMLPPPNVTGSLHMGHAFQDTIMDSLVRYHRMQGKNTLWQPGTDHAGIATQILVERQLEQQSIQKSDLSRAKFLEKVWEWKQTSGGTITKQLRRMGASLDWSRERFTMDEGLSAAVQSVFIQLYEEGLIYRGKRLVNWDPVLQTALSDLEVINQEESGFMYHIHYPFVDDPNTTLVIATTRPETMLADGAIAVHPEDERFTQLLGKKVHVPLTERSIEIIADEYVDPEFGSGCVKITGAHDFNDFEVTKRHEDKQLPLINLFTKDAKMNENAPLAYQGLDRFQAREKIVADLEAAGLIEAIKSHQYVLPKGDRSQAVLEPLLTEQWFVDAKTLAKPAIEAVENGSVKFVPKNWENTYFEWMNNIQDWCISRQLWWGHRIPAWLGDNGALFVAESEEAAYQQARLSGYQGQLQQDEDVLDTWFSSALWPFSTLGWPEKTPELEQFYPTSVLVTGFDIIFFWVARMMMFGLKFTGKVPFKEIYIHGLVRDANGQKMSKSKGNVLDPLDIIEGIQLDDLVDKRTSNLMNPKQANAIKKSTRKDYPEGIPAYGCDALRFTFAAMATTGRDIRFELSRCEGYRNFCNKLWNAARFTLMRVEGQPLDASESNQLFDRWIEARQQQVVAQISEHFKNYRLDLVSKALYEFVWHDFCDWYLEFTKVSLANESTAAQTHWHMLRMIESICRMVHPIVPFISERIWQDLKPLMNIEEDSLTLMPYPQPDAAKVNRQLEAEVHWIQSVVNGIRSIRAQMNISPSVALKVVIDTASAQEKTWLQMHSESLQALAKLDSLVLYQDSREVSKSASDMCGEGKLYVLLSGAVDLSQEVARLDREIAKLEKIIAQLSDKLNNAAFTEKAPEAVIDKVRSNCEAQQKALEHLTSQRQALAD